MNISLPDSMRTYVKVQVASGGYSTVSEYFRELVRLDQKRKSTQRLEVLLLEGLDSETATPMTAQDWEDIRQHQENPYLRQHSTCTTPQSP